MKIKLSRTIKKNTFTTFIRYNNTQTLTIFKEF